MFQIEDAVARRMIAMVAGAVLSVGLAAPVAAQDWAAPGADGADVVIDFSAPAEEDDLIDAARPGPSTRALDRTGHRAAERRRSEARHRERDFQTFDTAEGEEGQYWLQRSARPDRMERRGSFTIITLRTRRAAILDVTLVPGGLAYSSEAGSVGSIARPSVIDVEASRLDRRPYGPDGLDIISRGGPKIIRVSPDF
ncbi:hypothetical protein [Antarcticirhabdus aurantiaca]|uniref:hypothetical protein n=1 Tax=Antarcticirhabdus aurantiaca TaxID=2606717 RepID=UPI00131C675B|nr:hypothetical protein [Antarcticirhabdus aurantiaca]